MGIAYYARKLRLGAVRRLLPSGIALTYSQEGEDRILQRLLEYHGRGFYVDIGAHHPFRFSNTALLYEQGWSGLVVDPTPGLVEGFRKDRPRDIAVEVGIAASSGTLEYWMFDEPALNTFSSIRASTLEKTTSYRVIGRTQVPCISLAEAFDRYLPSGIEVDVLSIDVEGLDHEALASNDWNRYRPSLVIVEDLTAETLAQASASKVADAAVSWGYTPIAKTVNSVFLRRSS